MIPAFEVRADGADITRIVADRFLSLRIVDEDGMEADTLELTLDDRDGRIEFPATGAVLDVALGFEGAALTPMGTFAVDAVSGEGPGLTMTIGAKPADMARSIRAPKTRAWHDATLRGIVATIAGEANLEPAVHQDVAATGYGYLAQTAESDLHFLTRLARDLDAIAAPKGGRLLVVPKGQGLAEQAGVPLAPERLDRWRWSLGERPYYAKIEAEWSDTAGGDTRLVSVGRGDPVLRLRHPYATEAEALRACAARKATAGRETLRLTAVVAGFEPDLFAGGQLALSGVRSELAGEWYLRRVVHSLTDRLVTEIDARREKGETR